MDAITNFIKTLSSIESNENFTNLYHGENIQSEIRRNNLALYLNRMYGMKSSYMIVGEAPGHKGCRLTGIPFTCERIMVDLDFFKNDNYQFINNENQLDFEQSSNIVWTHIKNIPPSRFPVMWNIFPFHPHLQNNFNSNRTPNSREIEMGFVYLQQLIEIFNIKTIISVGRKAESKISHLPLSREFIFHPSYGKNLVFKEGIERIFKISQ